MTRFRWLTRTAVALAGVVLLAAFMVWLLWIPSARESPYRFVDAWGESGEAPGQFSDPTGIIASKQEIFVSDSRNGRVQVFSHQGELRRIIGEPGDGLGRPMGLAIHDDRLYVSDFWHDRITVFSLSGQLLRHIGEPGDGPGQFNGPGGIAVAGDGSLYVADFYNQRVQHLAHDGRFIDQWGTTGQIGFQAAEFNYPTDVSLGNQGEVIVADGYNDRIQVFRKSGDLVVRWGGPLALNISGGFPGWFATVSSVTTGPEGDIFAADFYNHRIQKFTIAGEFLTTFGERGDGPGQFDYVTAVSVAPDGTVFTTDFGNNRVVSWEPSSH